MSTCCWCTPGGISTLDFLKSYASRTLSGEFHTADEDLCYCLECVAEYHKAREELPFLHEVLWELETLRLITHFEKSMKAELADDDDDELYIVDSNGEAQLFDFTGQDFENKLRVPLLEILKYPYLLLHERVNELCVEALCRMEQANCSFQVFDKHPGIYLFLVHPNEMVRRWAILTARNLGKVDRDDYYDLQEVLTCLFKVIELGLLESPDIYTSSVLEKGKLILLPSHMYDTANYKNYWLGICMLLTILEEQAMDSLLLGSDKQNDFMRSILHTMQKQSNDDSMDPFWPALHCFMVILDRLGSKVWGQLIDPIEAFQTIINNVSYNREIQNIRNSSVRTKLEPEPYSDDMVTCSQIVYNYNPEKTKKDSGWRSAICPDYCPNMYEEMETLANVLQSDIGQDMRVHNSTFLWFIPFVQSLMDLKDLGVAYIVEVIHHLYSEVKNVLNHADAGCDKVTEFFLLILVSVIELHRNKKCLHLLWVSSQQWVEAVVKCAKLPTTAFARISEKSPGSFSKGTAMMSSLSLHSVPSNSVQLACVQLIRSLLKEGYQLGHHALCKRFWNKLNLFLRGNLSLGWQLTNQETYELQTCLKQIIRNIKFKAPPCSTTVDPTSASKSPLVSFKQENEEIEKSKKDVNGMENCSPTFTKELIKMETCQMQGSPLSRVSNIEWEDVKPTYPEDLNGDDQLPSESHLVQSSKGPFTEGAPDPVKPSRGKQKSVKEKSLCTSTSGPERGSDRGVIVSTYLLTDCSTDSLEKVSTSNEDFTLKDDHGKISQPKSKVHQDEICAKLFHVIQQQPRRSTSSLSNAEGSKTVCDSEAESSVVGAGITRDPSAEPDAMLDVEQKPEDSLLLPKKQWKSEELDFYSPHEKSCQIQERHGKGVVSSTDMTNMSVTQSPFKHPATVLESRDKEANKSADWVSSTRDEASDAAPKPTVGTDGPVDRDLHKVVAQASVIKFPSNSSKKSSPKLERKVKSDKRCSTANQNSVADSSYGQVIVISDSDEEEELLDLQKHANQDTVSSTKREVPGQCDSGASASADKFIKEEDAKCILLESDSQFFEFESASEVFSVWQDHKEDSKDSAEDVGGSSGGVHVSAEAEKKGSPKRAEPCTRDEELCEIEVKKPRRKQYEKPVAKDPPRPSSVRKKEQSRNDNDLQVVVLGTTEPSPAALKRSSPKLRTYSKPIRKVPASKTPKKTHSESKRGQNKSSHYLTCRTTPAVVPPKKFRQCPEPASTVEKLGLKKAPRKAFELSQRSLDYLVQLRDHGKSVGVVETRKKAKLISPQTLPVKNNKKLLPNQDDVQLHKQAKPKNRKDVLVGENTRAKRTRSPAAASVDVVRPESGRPDQHGKGSEVLASSGEKQLIHLSSPKAETPQAKRASKETSDDYLLNYCDSRGLNGKVPASDMPASTSEGPGGGESTGRSGQVAVVTQAELDSGSDTDDDNLYLTQHDPEDMDLCSQMDAGYPHLIEVIPREDGLQTEDAVCPPQEESSSNTKCKYKDCVETVKAQSEYCAQHSEAKAAEDNVFRKPGLPLSAVRPLRPTTTKVFSSSGSSRIANLSRSLDNSIPSALRNKPTQSILKMPQSSAVSQKPVAEVKSLCSAVNPQSPTSAVRPVYRPPLAASSPANALSSSQSISDAFIKEVLKWSYEMFLNFGQCGAPPSLSQCISRSVPVRFQDCAEYFDVFLPLMILNTFETMAQEWISSSNKDNCYQVQLKKFAADYKKSWEFVVYLDESELAKQLHPKENDLVFLRCGRVSGEKKDTERSNMADHHMYYCGYVHKFRRTALMRSGKSECSLSIQIQDHLPASLNELMKCVVIGSLVTTQRKLKAMSLLSGRNQLARAILNPNPMDFCTKDLPAMSSERILNYLKDFNEDQKKAIETAYAMVKHSPSVAKICLIHGPPGTGKSKTIVGLLYRLLTENPRKGHSDENSNAKNKQNRVLVCAPSNAAVDELMKKIILEFKEKCKDKKNPLGNCGDINLVRLGPEKSINNEVLRFSLDSQVNHRMKKDLPSHVQEMHRKKEFLDHQLDELSRQRALCRGGREMQRKELDEKITRVSKERQELASKIKEVQGRPQKTQNNIILESHVICCTLSTSGGLLLESAFRGQGGQAFSCVIVDEAGQSCEVETLTPLIHRCNKLILVGDPKQLPPTVISLKAQECGYDQSMMARFYKLLEESVEQNRIGRLPVVQLTIQYRMHPDICLFPSNYIYNKSLKTNRLTEANRCSSDWPFQPYLVFDVADGSERRDNDSYVNIQEIKLVMEIMKLIKDKRRDTTFRNIGIITHYKAQKTMIQKDLDKEFDRKGSAEVDTVDAFQGRQKDCIIVTCVRASATQGSIGFLASLQRLNVTITRAKYSLFILGHLRTLMENEHWNHLIQDAQKRGAIVKTCDKNYKHDAAKIMKLKPVLQRSLTHPPTGAPEAARPQGGLPSSRLDSGLASTSFAASLYHTPSNSKEVSVTITSNGPERPYLHERLRDPRLCRRLELDAKGVFLRNPQPSSPQHSGATPPLGEPGFPVSHQDQGGRGSTPKVTPGSNGRSLPQAKPPAPSHPAPSSVRRGRNPEPGLSHRRETRAFSRGEQERYGSVSYHPKRNSYWSRRGPEEDGGSKKRRLL
ncbi:probable helicase senataxin [Perognathus longimembris pacificus]|uniref:probable helicase senataxin n=1 Tax=Perognathus longimembris pacificus TaxID=214514 RepID=UPI002019F486|nr:probable helicase senataxin [Perognathus longimembris pacificus]XP_048201354.1 probable helicase senataxin [Perognathus longimembris pacificus]